MNIPRMIARTAVVLSVSVFFSVLCHGDPIVNDSPRPTITVPQATLTPTLTADANDAAWAQAVMLPPLTPSLGAQPPSSATPETKVQLLWTPDYLYVRFTCHDTEIYTPIHGHDAPIYKGDAVEIFLDAVGDARQWIELEFNADNDVFDQMFLCTAAEPVSDASLCLSSPEMGRNTWNFLSWDMTGLQSKAVRVSLAPNEQDWIVDIAIPAKELLQRLGLKQFAPMTLRGDFIRYKDLLVAPGQPRKFLPLNWSPVSSGRPHRSPAAYGYIILAATPAPAGDDAKTAPVPSPVTH